MLISKFFNLLRLSNVLPNALTAVALIFLKFKTKDSKLLSLDIELIIY